MNDFLQSLRNGQAEKPRTPKTRKNFDNSYHYTSSPRFQSYGSGGYQNNRSQHTKRPGPPQQGGNQLPMEDTATTSMLAEAIENLNSHIEILAKNQDYLTNAQERTADMLERQAIALERIVTHFNIVPGQESNQEKADSFKQKLGNHYVASKTPEPVIAEPVIAEPVIAEPVIAEPVIAEPVIAEPVIAEPVKKPLSTKPILRKRKKVVAKKEETPVSGDKKRLSRAAIMDIINSMRADGATFDTVATRLVELGQPTFSGRGEWHAQTIHRLCNKK